MLVTNVLCLRCVVDVALYIIIPTFMATSDVQQLTKAVAGANLRSLFRGLKLPKLDNGRDYC